MKRCIRCGWVSEKSEDMFCLKCGSPLEEYPEGEEKGRKISGGIVLAVCLLAAVLIGGGVFLGFRVLQKNQGETLSSETAEADGQSESADQQEENMLEGAEEEAIQQFEIPDFGDGEIQEQDTESEEDTVPEQETEAAPVSVQEPEAAEDPVREQEEESLAEEETETAICYVVNCKESVSLRKSPSTKAEAYCQIPLGEAVAFVDNAANGFCMVSYNGQTGYVLASYLSFGSESGKNETQEIRYMQVVNCKESITLRKTPSTKGDEFCQIPLGAVVEFKGTAENGFYMVVYNGYTGYALASYLKEC